MPKGLKFNPQGWICPPPAAPAQTKSSNAYRLSLSLNARPTYNLHQQHETWRPLLPQGRHNEKKSTPIKHHGRYSRWLGVTGAHDVLYYPLPCAFSRFATWTMMWGLFTNYFSLNAMLYRPEPQSQFPQFRLAIGSYIEQYNNSVQILKTRMALSPGSEYPSMQIYSACEIEHPYPCTKILWSPDGGKTGGNYGGRDLLATTGDYLRWD